MSTTAAIIQADPETAQKAYEPGPARKRGTIAARLDSLSLGLRSEAGLVPPHLVDAVARHAASLAEVYRPEGEHQVWLLGQVADAAARLDHCQFMIRAHHDDQIDRAELCWDVDRESAVETLAARLPKAPSRISRQLRETAQGVRWLLARWDALSVPLDEHRGWDETQCQLAATLMGVGPELLPLHPELKPGADPATLTALLREQVDALHLLMTDALDPLDAKERTLARLGFSLRPSRELLRLERLEGKLRRVLNESMAAFRHVRAEGRTGPEPVTLLRPEPAARPPVILPPEPEPSPDPLDESDADFEPMPTPSPEFLADKPVFAMLAKMVETIQANRIASAPSQPAAPSKPAAPLNRRARRAQEKLARKARAAAR